MAEMMTNSKDSRKRVMIVHLWEGENFFLRIIKKGEAMVMAARRMNPLKGWAAQVRKKNKVLPKGDLAVNLSKNKKTKGRLQS
jgi:hypothetical protein